MTELRTIPGVELARVGTWQASTGAWTCTREQLADAVRATKDPAFRTPILKAGHVDPRFNNVAADGEPALGRVTNLRLREDGDVLVGDYEGVPAWLADVLPSAYPSRSVEMNLDVETVDGAKYAGVLTAVALLGVTAPAVENLADVAALYGYAVAAAGDRWTARTAVAAAALPPAVPAVWPPLPDLTAPMSTGGTVTDTAPTARPDVAAAADLETIRPAFYEWVKHNDDGVTKDDLEDAYVCEVWTDSLIVADWEEGRYWRVTWTETGGTFTFGAPQRVTRTYVPVADTMAARATADMHRPLRWFRGRDDVSASSPQGAQPVADPTTAPQTPTGLRERLGLAADATDDAVLAAVEALQAKPNTPAPTEEPKADDTPAPAVPSTVVPDDIATLVREQVAAATGPLLQQVTDLSTELAGRKAAEQVTRRESVLASALAAGKITPGNREKWAAQYDAAPSVVEALLDATAAGSAMPVMASGVVGSEPTTSDDDLYAQVFGTRKEA